jgi:hypothetical protein
MAKNSKAVPFPRPPAALIPTVESQYLPGPPEDQQVLQLILLGHILTPGADWRWDRGRIKLIGLPLDVRQRLSTLKDLEELRPMLLCQGITMSPTCRSFVLRDGAWAVPKERE